MSFLLDVNIRRVCNHCLKSGRIFDFWVRLVLISLPLMGAGAVLENYRGPGKTAMCMLFLLFAVGLIFYFWAERHPMSWLFQPLRRHYAKQYVRDWPLTKIRRDGPYLIEPWDLDLIGAYKARFVQKVKVASKDEEFTEEAEFLTKRLDQLEPNWFNDVVEDVIAALPDQAPPNTTTYGWRRSGFNEVRQLLDDYCPDWLARGKVVRTAYARTIEQGEPAEFLRWCDLFDHSDPEWLTAGQFRAQAEGVDCFPLIVNLLAAHATKGQPDVFHGPPSDTSSHEWPRRSFVNVHRHNYAEHPWRLMLQKLVDCTAAGLRNHALIDWNRDALRSLVDVSHVGFCGPIGSYTENYQSDIDALTRSEEITVSGLAVVVDASLVQGLAAQRLGRAKTS